MVFPSNQSACAQPPAGRVRSSLSVAVGVILGAVVYCSGNNANAQQPDPPGQSEPGETPQHEAYLFAHMTHRDYGRLYYSVSRDGLHWKQLGGGKRVFDEYKGHPSIVLGHDGRYYLVGNRSDAAETIHFWVSDDLIHWEKHSDFTPDIHSIPDYPEALQRIGAPKLFYDSASRQYVLTWHTPHVVAPQDDPEAYWASQRTIYVTSADLKQFSAPAKLFDWNFATIDVVLQRDGDAYYAILKDETYPTLDWVTGKTIRIAKSANLLGPYAEPGPPLSPNFREAPNLIPSPNGTCWYLYYEQYPGVSYGLSVSDSLDGKWFHISGNTNFADWDKYRMPAKVRHGCMLVISKQQYDALCDSFP
ncbi:glycoside hydrolase family 43 protein [Aeoliella sp. ICT_H6.2]|uniref:Glycoside hydrolase family 43 protein n=1 Tax=Aeoliella straminimaris TaxID=2954799 RepID=A0A9X2FF54_9BACT|nr:glycoside hydrolase family 43 protein [Aeoliella straminimaris]MCO6048032.1 glycoside hydrolase family 43 protein [Aeoliella straminimaris]